ncbi:hypothetical protein HC761_01495, partial [bacterium]|nr:hypothetical protein [bacterium]
RFQASTAPIFVRTDQFQAQTNGEFLATARVIDASQSNAVIAALVGLFASDGTRIWQAQVIERQRPYQTSSQSALNTQIARASNGDVYLGIQAIEANPAAAPVKVCRIQASGIPAGCFSAPLAGRLVALLRDSNSESVIAFARAHTGATIESQLTTQMYAVNTSGFSAAMLTIPEHIALAADSFLPATGAIFAVLGTLNNYGAYVDRPSGLVKLFKISIASDLIFTNGFED